MNTVLLSACDELAGELSLLLGCRWEDAQVVTAKSLEDAADVLEMSDIVFVDVGTFSRRYAGLIQEVAAIWPGPIVAVSRESLGVEVQVAALRAGADDVWPDFPPDTILFIARTHALVRRVRGEELVRVGRLTLMHESQEVRIEGRRILQLTPTEYRLLHKLAANRNHIVRFESMVDEVWEGEAVDRAAVRKLVQRLRNKLGDRAGVEIVSHPGVGYSLRRADDEQPILSLGSAWLQPAASDAS